MNLTNFSAKNPTVLGGLVSFQTSGTIFKLLFQPVSSFYYFEQCFYFFFWPLALICGPLILIQIYLAPHYHRHVAHYNSFQFLCSIWSPKLVQTDTAAKIDF